VKREPKRNNDKKGTETIYRNSDFTSNTMALNSYSILTLNVNGLNAANKRHTLHQLEWQKLTRQGTTNVGEVVEKGEHS